VKINSDNTGHPQVEGKIEKKKREPHRTKKLAIVGYKRKHLRSVSKG